MDKSIQAFINDNLSPAAQQKYAAQMARDELEKAQAQNERAVGRPVPYEQFVNGVKGAPLNTVNPNGGSVVFIFDTIGDEVLRWIKEMLILHSPIGDPPIHYFQSHVLLADGVEIDNGQGLGLPDKIPPAEKYTFVNIVPYARKIERGQSQQSPDGVYEVVADMAKRRFGNIAQIKFTYVSTIPGGFKGQWTKQMEHASRNPAIEVVMR